VSGLVITCPDCQTSYNADANSIGESGRNVRCARCGVTWFVPPPDIIDQLITDPDALAHADNVAASQPDEPEVQSSSPISDPIPPVASSATPAFAATYQPDNTPDLPSTSAYQDEAVHQTEPTYRDEPPVDDPGLARPDTIGADVMMRDMADSEKLARRQRTIRIIWAVPVLIVLIAAIAAWFNRQSIVNRIPQMASVYQMLGADVRAGGLEIVPPDARTVLVDGASVIRIESAVRNLTRKAKTVPLIELTLHDDAGQSLAQWYVEIGSTKLAGGERMVFTSEYADPPAGAVGLRYRFVGVPS